LKTWALRSASYAVVAFLAAAALRLTPRIEPEAPGRLLVAPSPAVAAFVQRTDTLGRGETLYNVLARGGVSELVAREALNAAKLLDPRRVPAGMEITVKSEPADSLPSEIVLHLAVDRMLRLTRTDTGWTENDERLPWTKDTIAISGRIASTLYEALDSAAQSLPSRARAELAWTLADIYEYRIDMSRDLQEGDEFRALVERERAPNGLVRIGDVIAASFENGGAEVSAIRFSSRTVSGEYFDASGKSLRAPFLRAPLSFRRISSVFGMRRHPILGVKRAHKGTDYAASSGTPVRAVGDGVVSFAGRRGGYGNVLEIRHRNGYLTRHAHLRGFARGVRVGRRVGIGETVAYVGSTGLSTAPHLHFEVLVNGVQRDPRTALRMKGGEPIPASERTSFMALRDRMIALLESPEATGRLALR
jgi:murein DD-endopeptidase MepM/ murein hydrolase activator NlpD